MKLTDLVGKIGYENDTYRICKFLGFTDTDELKSAKFFSQEESYEPVPLLGISMPTGDISWRVCQVFDESDELYSVDYGYKITLTPLKDNGEFDYGSHRYYQAYFLALLKTGCIIPYVDGAHIEHIQWREPIEGSVAYVVHEADVVIK